MFGARGEAAPSPRAAALGSGFGASSFAKLSSGAGKSFWNGEENPE